MLGKLIYTTIDSLDGFVADKDGNFDWSEPDAEVHGFINELQRDIGTYLYGRRMYEVMKVWEEPGAFADSPRFVRDFARIWRGAEKVVYSGTLTAVSTAKTRIESEFLPEAVRQMKSNSPAELSIGGAALAGVALREGLVDEYRRFIVPIVVGGGKPSLPEGLRMELDLIEQTQFGNGTVYLRYQIVD